MLRHVGMLCLFVLLVPQVSLGASLYIDPGVSELSRGDALKLSVRLDTDESVSECVNAVEGVITFSGPIKPVDVSIGDSIFSVWVEPPQLNDDQTLVTFAGGIPNGYCGRVDGDPRLTNNVFDVVVRADAVAASDGLATPAEVSFTNQSVAYLNDGLGTQAELRTLPGRLTINPTFGDTVQDPWSDEIEADDQTPQPFSIDLQRDQLAFSNKYYVSFNTTDKQTGVDRYEIMEEPIKQFWLFRWGRADAPWREVRSPYVLQDQSLNSTIRVRAIDKAGNEYVATIVPDESLRTLSFSQFLVYLVLGMVVLIVAGGSWLYTSRQREKKRQAELAAIEANYTTTYEE